MSTRAVQPTSSLFKAILTRFMLPKRRKSRPFTSNKTTRRRSITAAFRTLATVEDQRTRNLLRGAISNPTSNYPSSDAINELRKTASPTDLALSAQILLGRQGAFPLPNVGDDCKALTRSYSLKATSTQAELAFVIGHVNGWSDEACMIVEAMSALAGLPQSAPSDAMTAVADFVQSYGASSFAVRKTAFVTSRYPNDESMQAPYQRVADGLGLSKFSAPFFMAVELLDSKFSYLSGVSTRVQIQQKYNKGDFRRVPSLHDVVPVPLSKADLGAHLRKSYSTSLVDELVSIICVFTLRQFWPDLHEFVRTLLHPHVCSKIESFLTTSFDASALYSDADSDRADIVYYRRALAFVEFAPCAHFRAFVDATLAPRLMANCAPEIDRDFKCRDSLTIRDLTTALRGFHQPDDYLKVQTCGLFLRTIQLLDFLEQSTVFIGFSQHEMRFVCEHTQGLDLLLSEDELEKLYASASGEARPLVTVLALALHKARARDEDVDFKFRYALCETVKAQFRGSLEEFIKWLLHSTPQIANYLLSILDRQTLQKLYWLVHSADEADTTRQALLRAVGKQRNDIAYFVEADAIEAGRQVAKLRRYFDDSRLYVDGIAMKEWLVANPSVYAQQYMTLIERSVGASARSSKSEVNQFGFGNLDAVTAFDYVLIEVARVAFEQFCTNRHFGIESYLGRRIRHNTLTGMMRGGVEELIEHPTYKVLRYDRNFAKANNDWIESYRKLIEHARRDLLQFRSDAKPQGVFSSAIRGDENTFLAIANLRNTFISVRNPDLLNELLIRFCWQEINPQLQAAAKLISVELVKAASDDVDKCLGHFGGELQGQYRQHLQEEVHERFTRLASWFRQPENGFVNASTRQLVELILVEAKDNNAIDGGPDIDWQGDGLDVQMDGLSVHRMYDCLFVLLRNALRYGLEGSIIVNACQQATARESLSRLFISVSSELEDDSSRSYHTARLAESFASDNPEDGMVTEGYSGIRKLRYITRNSEGVQAASYRIENSRCIVSFFLTVELATQATPQ